MSPRAPLAQRENHRPVTARLTIDIHNHTRRRIDLVELRRLLRRALKLEKVRQGQWQISLVADAAMAALHQRSMGIPTTTDVLTFDLRDHAARAARGDLLDLDTVICLDEARRQTQIRKHSLGSEVLLYAIHSLLHVCGHDDLEPAAAAKMHAREDAILEAMGIGSVYAVPHGGKPLADETRPRTRKGKLR